jgi:trigger factor
LSEKQPFLTSKKWGLGRFSIAELNTEVKNLKSQMLNAKIQIKSALVRADDGTLTLQISIPKQRVAEAYQAAFAKLAAEIEIPGFRKGKAPENLVKDRVDKKKVYEKVVEEIIPEAYFEAVKEQGINPILNPKVKLISAKENEDWQIETQTCETPKIALGNYREEIRKINTEGKIWLPGQEKEKDKESQQEERVQKILEVLLRVVSLVIPPLLLEAEVNHRLATVIEKTEKLGITIDQYLASLNLTAQALREKYEKEAADSLKLEFILSQIAEEEKITVEPAEIEGVIEKTADKKEKETLRSQKYLLAQILRRKKTLDFLLNL